MEEISSEFSIPECGRTSITIHKHEVIVQDLLATELMFAKARLMAAEALVRIQKEFVETHFNVKLKETNN